MLDRLSAVGSIMWGVGQDARLRMVVGDLLVLDRAPSRSALAERLGVVAGQVAAVAAASGWVGRVLVRVRSGLMIGGLMRMITFV